MIRKLRIQSQKGHIDKVISIVVPPTGEHDIKFLRGLWFRAKELSKADKFLDELKQQVKKSSRAQDLIKNLERHQGFNIVDIKL